VERIDWCEVFGFQPSGILSCFAQRPEDRIEDPSSTVMVLDMLSIAVHPLPPLG
jgi:hypothetical protein